MLSFGTTTCEAKSGYGLNTETELKILKAQKKLNETHPVDIVSTFLGAHAVPKEHKPTEYVDLVINEMLPKVKGLARYCTDLSCKGCTFSINNLISMYLRS